jgi:hypothetical protein
MSQYSTALPNAILNDAGLAVTAGWLTVYSIEPDQREYQQASLEYLPQGVGLPAFCFADKPTLPKAGLALVRSLDGSAWETPADYRGQTAYSTETGQPETVTRIGELDNGFTLLAPATPYDTWNGETWVTDTAAQQAAAINAARDELAQRQRVAAERIALLEDAVSLGMATEEETAALLVWKAYRVQLSRIDLETAPNIEWPEMPGF